MSEEAQVTPSRGREIPRGEWLSFLDCFNRQHERWLVTVEIVAEQLGHVIAVENRALQGVTPESSDGHDRIVIAVGTAEADHMTHFVSDPKRIRMLETSSGAHLGLEIEAADGTTTLVRFRGPLRPEMLNDIAA
jgi:hypothetical protein